MKRTILLFVCIFLVCCRCDSFAQSANVISELPKKIRVNVNLMYVSVDARDASGNPMNGLTLRDFRVFQNGKEAPVKALEIVDNQIKRSGPVDVALVLCNKGCLAEEDMRKAATATLGLFGNEDRVSLYTTSRYPKKLSGFTNDFDALKKMVALVTVDPQEMVPQYAALKMALQELAALKSERPKILAYIAGENLFLGWLEYHEIKAALIENKVKFWDIGEGYQDQRELAYFSKGISNNVGLVTKYGIVDDLAEALRQFRIMDIPANRYFVAFTPSSVSVNEETGATLQSIEVRLDAAKYGELARDYNLIVQKPLIRGIKK